MKAFDNSKIIPKIDFLIEKYINAKSYADNRNFFKFLELRMRLLENEKLTLKDRHLVTYIDMNVKLK